jgi:hypothetical protein
VKIVQLDSQRYWRGGEQQVLYLSQALQAHGYHNVIVCQPHSALYQRACEAGLYAKALPMRREIDVVAAWRLGHYLRQQRVDILHMHAPHAHSIGLLACMLAPRVQKIVSRRVDFAPIRNLFSRYKYTTPNVQYLTVSDAVRQVLLRSGIPEHRMQTIHSGIEVVLTRVVAPTCPRQLPSFLPARVCSARWDISLAIKGTATCSERHTISSSLSLTSVL